MSNFELVLEPRTELGKGATRRLRREGKVPAIVYGGGSDPKTYCVPVNVIRKQLENEAFYSTLLTVKTPDGSESAVLKDLQRHPATSEVTHIDLLRASATQILNMRIPLHFINEASAPGRIAGGVVQHALIDVDVTCMAKDLPEYLEIDLGNLELGQGVHLSDITLPEGVELTALGHGEDSQDLMVASIVAPASAEEDEVAEGEEGEEDAGVAPDEDTEE